MLMQSTVENADHYIKCESALRVCGAAVCCKNKVRKMGSGCGLVGGVVASYTRCLWFKSSYQQIFYSTNLLLTVDKTKT